MELPPIMTPVTDEGRDLRFEIYAYRELEPHEAIAAAEVAFRQLSPKQKRQRGSVHQVLTLIGLRDSLSRASIPLRSS